MLSLNIVIVFGCVTIVQLNKLISISILINSKAIVFLIFRISERETTTKIRLSDFGFLQTTAGRQWYHQAS